MEEINVKNKESLVPVCEKYTLTIKEAAAYFNIGIKKMRRLAEENTGRFSVFVEISSLLFALNLKNLLMSRQKYNLLEVVIYLPKVVDK